MDPIARDARRGGGAPALGAVLALVMVLTPSRAQSADVVIIGNGPDAPDGSYLNARTVADNLCFTNLYVSAGAQIDIADPVDLTASPYCALPEWDFTLTAPTVNVQHDVIFGTGTIYMEATALNLAGTFTSGGIALASPRLSGLATALEVLGPTASIAQAVDFASTTATATIHVAPGLYRGSLDLTKPVAIVGDTGDPLVPGAGPGAPVLVGSIPGSSIVNVTGVPAVRLEGLRFQASMDGNPANDSAVAVSATAANGLVLSNDSFAGFTVHAMNLLFGSGQTVAYDAFSGTGGATLDGLVNLLAVTGASVHDNVILASSPIAITTNGGVPLTLAPGAQQAFEASGGTGAYSWTLTINASGGSITPQGLYTAGASADATDTVTVTDSAGATASVAVVVAGPSPAAAQAPALAGGHVALAGILVAGLGLVAIGRRRRS